MIFKRRITPFLLSSAIISGLLLLSCEDYLALKPDKKLAVPETLQDMQLILDRVSDMNCRFSSLSEVSADNYYLSNSNWLSLTPIEYRNEYIWSNEPVYSIHWASPYIAIFYANNVLEYIKKIQPANAEEDVIKMHLTGAALFFRGIYFLNLADVFSKAYSDEHKNDLGIVLRLSPDINIKSIRATLQNSYDQILSDLKASVRLLPNMVQSYPTRPNKAAGYGALARACLTMGDYAEAYAYADSCLQLQGGLLNYNSIIKTSKYPFERFNEEVVFYSTFTNDANINISRSRVSDSLFNTYDDKDLRKYLFFEKNPDSTIVYTGDYAATTSGYFFNGITTAEMILIRAEGLVRQGRFEEARADLSSLCKNRYKNGILPLGIYSDSEYDLLYFILKERKKELIFRGSRWSDLRRLSQDPRFNFNIRRKVNNQVYTLTPQAIYNFAHLIPSDVVERSGIDQN